jgi:septum formation inhibitor-activating ATPase MinD
MAMKLSILRVCVRATTCGVQLDSLSTPACISLVFDLINVIQESCRLSVTLSFLFQSLSLMNWHLLPQSDNQEFFQISN